MDAKVSCLDCKRSFIIQDIEYEMSDDVLYCTYCGNRTVSISEEEVELVKVKQYDIAAEAEEEAEEDIAAIAAVAVSELKNISNALSSIKEAIHSETRRRYEVPNK